MTRLVCIIPIKPVAKQRARSAGDHFYTPAQTAEAEAFIRQWWNNGVFAAWYEHVPVRLTVTAVMQRPKRPITWAPVTKPDASNVLKLVEDALNDGVAYADDAQIVDTRCIKRYCRLGEAPHIEIVLEEVKEEEEDRP